MKHTYSEIKEVAYDLFGASSAKKAEWIEEFEAYLNGDYNTVWNDEGFADWTEEEKKECLDIILMNYKEDKTMKEASLCYETIGAMSDYFGIDENVTEEKAREVALMFIDKINEEYDYQVEKSEYPDLVDAIIDLYFDEDI